MGGAHSHRNGFVLMQRQKVNRKRHADYARFNGFFRNISNCHEGATHFFAQKKFSNDWFYLYDYLIILDLESSACNFKASTSYALVRFWNYSPDYTLNCTLLDTLTITKHATIYPPSVLELLLEISMGFHTKLTEWSWPY